MLATRLTSMMLETATTQRMFLIMFLQLLLLIDKRTTGSSNFRGCLPPRTNCLIRLRIARVQLFFVQPCPFTTDMNLTVKTRVVGQEKALPQPPLWCTTQEASLEVIPVHAGGSTAADNHPNNITVAFKDGVKATLRLSFVRTNILRSLVRWSHSGRRRVNGFIPKRGS